MQRSLLKRYRDIFQPNLTDHTDVPDNEREIESDEKNTNSTLAYPRPRPLFVVTDCGCPYTCDESQIHNITGNKKSCYQSVKEKLPIWGEEFACLRAANSKDKLCPAACNPEKCQKPPLDGLPVDKKEPFTRHDNVVIVSKIMGWPFDTAMMLQALCLLTAAYNDRVNYDIVVFTTEPQPREMEEKFQAVVHPANFRFVYENSTVPDLVRSMSPRRREFILKNCNKAIDELRWDMSCPNIGALRYNWQAEFRGYHIWKHPALEKYKYMMWIDADNYCTRPWKSDPVDFVVRNNLTVAYSNWPAGSSLGLVQDRIKEYFGTNLCRIVKKDGVLVAETGDCPGARWGLIHGFFHITDLDFYRANIEWMRKLIGEDRLSRNPDDQEAMTSAAVMLSPGRVRDLEDFGHKLNIMHNGDVDGKYKISPAMYKRWWPMFAERDFPDAFDKCKDFICCAG
eukprot:CAMPEP_0172480648 /NCGR_PEP_ID=MMETSP1066-20121228/5966_1 /TAXON_ID=671091 /ORGANISM="Coscinodiscus wailesii, Strain CCMP2513" /LENGTH=452 /DNA_ID=CAMNT_0013242179 /DNA_START=128 /DNA_END=1486 /DNA_ORIENTATION=+